MAPRPFLVDQLTGLVGTLLISAILASRWHVYTPKQRALLSLLFPYALAHVLIPHFAECWYRKWRTWVVLSYKLVLVLLRCDGRPLVQLQVRLNEPPTASPLQDSFKVLAGLRLASLAVVGMTRLPWPIWVLQQAAVIMRVANVDEDCTSPLLSHPIMADRIALFHKGMELLASLLVPQAAMLTPKTELGRCKAAVTYCSVLFGLLLPALMLVQPQRAQRAQHTAVERRTWAKGWLSSLDAMIDRGLRELRYCGGDAADKSMGRKCLAAAFRWWLLLVLLWEATTLTAH